MQFIIYLNNGEQGDVLVGNKEVSVVRWNRSIIYTECTYSVSENSLIVTHFV